MKIIKRPTIETICAKIADIPGSLFDAAAGMPAGKGQGNLGWQVEDVGASTVSTMPAFVFRPEKIRDVVAYIRNLTHGKA